MEVRVHDFTDWRNKARALLIAGTEPASVAFVDKWGNSDLFAHEDAGVETTILPASTGAGPPISAEFMQRARWVAHHSSAERWQRLYTLAWRLIYENKALLDNPIDPDVLNFSRWAKAVARDYHKMKAFVRFQSISDFGRGEQLYRAPNVFEPETLNQADLKTAKSSFKRSAPAIVPGEDPHFIAWFEPEHFVLPLAADFFVKRFNNMSWSILTPYECAHWHQQRLIFTDGAARPPLPQDQTEALWLQYYGSIFNPARVKVNAMRKEMPKKYWKNLPEAQLIKSLLQHATKRVDGMIDAASKNG